MNLFAEHASLLGQLSELLAVNLELFPATSDGAAVDLQRSQVDIDAPGLLASAIAEICHGADLIRGLSGVGLGRRWSATDRSVIVH